MLDTNACGGQGAIDGALLIGEEAALWFFMREPERHLRQAEPKKAKIDVELATGGQAECGLIGQPLVMHAPLTGRAKIDNARGGIAEQQVFEGMALFLATVALIGAIAGALDRAFGAI